MTYITFILYATTTWLTYLTDGLLIPMIATGSTALKLASRVMHQTAIF